MRTKSGGIKVQDNAAFGVQPQGFGVANRSTAARPSGRVRLSRLKTLVVWRYRGRGALQRRSNRNRNGAPHCCFDTLSSPEPGVHLARKRFQLTQSWSHRLVIWSAAALRWNPGDITVRVLYVAGFAVDAVLGVDDEARP